ncbi:hypothetical protein [Mesorhizobium sp.]|uniref:hypothetical protein n=1 Tax=Mesorhizobium sp. TaxID=1871066 RepID=UPI0025C4A45C|nr:hypothetical protein [Mesorhizobium sp.]
MAGIDAQRYSGYRDKVDRKWLQLRQRKNRLALARQASLQCRHDALAKMSRFILAAWLSKWSATRYLRLTRKPSSIR